LKLVHGIGAYDQKIRSWSLPVDKFRKTVRAVMEKRILRFKNCDSKFYPYLEKVLNRLPHETKEDILNNKNLQILGNEDFLATLGMNFRFDDPITNIVYLNQIYLKEPEHSIIYTIAHELAHYVAGKGETGLYEKEAEEKMLKWGFNVEVEKRNYHRPILESFGYKAGYMWASKQKEQGLLDDFGEFFEDWDDDTLSGEQIEKLHYAVDPTSIMAEVAQFEDEDGMSEDSEKDMIIDDGFGDKGVIWGIMGRLKEIIVQKNSIYIDEDASKTEFINTLEEINRKFIKLFSLNACTDFFREMHHYEIPELSIKVDQFLEEYKRS